MHIASGDVSDAAINHAYVYGKKRVEYLGTDQKCFCAPGRDRSTPCWISLKRRFSRILQRIVFSLHILLRFIRNFSLDALYNSEQIPKMFASAFRNCEFAIFYAS